MVKEIQAVIWKEWKELIFQQSLRSKLRFVFLIIIAGIVMPLQKGIGWFNQLFFLGIGFIGPLLMMLTIICDLFAGERERHTLETLLASRISDKGFILGKLIYAISYAICITLFLLVLNLITINAKFFNQRFIIFSSKSAVIIFSISFSLAFFSALLGILISLKASTVKQAQLTLSILMMLIIFLPSYLISCLPSNIKSHFVHYFNFLGVTNSILIICSFLFLAGMFILTYIFSKYKRVNIFK